MHPKIQPEFPLSTRSSMFNDWGLCETKGYWAWLRHQRPKLADPNLLAGAAFAKGLEVARKSFYEQGLPIDLATMAGIEALWKEYGNFDPPADNPKSWQRMTGALEYYVDQHPFNSDPVQPYQMNGKNIIEFTFALPLNVLHPVTGDPILYTGRFDMVGHSDNVVWCVDEKTTKQLGQTWASKWELRGQFLGYMWAALEHGVPVQGTCVRGIAIRKEGYDMAESFQMHTKGQIKAWLAQVEQSLERMKRSWAENWYDQNGILSGACSFFNGCAFRQLCKSDQPELWLSSHFETRVEQTLKVEEEE